MQQLHILSHFVPVSQLLLAISILVPINHVLKVHVSLRLSLTGTA